tara:strand:- start:1203 stop:1352 length:150 start_codon:yes stop_codon:yes gene_type:complete
MNYIEKLEIVRCENGVGEWEIYPTGETFDTRGEAETRLAELTQEENDDE